MSTSLDELLTSLPPKRRHTNALRGTALATPAYTIHAELRVSLGTLWTGLNWTWVALEVAIAVGTRARRAKANIQDQGTQVLLWVVIILSLTASGWMRHLKLADMHLAESWLRPATVALLAAGLVVRVTAILTLGKWFTANVATHASQTIQRAGLYRVVRHPSYLGMEIIFLAIGLHAHDWACLAAAFIPPTLAVLFRIHVEEAALLGAFGEEYADYMRTTKRLIPGVY
jgi:protein-S-isoprenylcysteine O-methyltransferase Ste14